MVSLTKPQPRTIAIVSIVILAITLAIFVGLFGANYGDPNCNCISPMDAGWRASSILLVIMMLIIVILLLIYPEALVTIGRS
jgi:H+/Cl- antiporter ClcA